MKKFVFIMILVLFIPTIGFAIDQYAQHRHSGYHGHGHDHDYPHHYHWGCPPPPPPHR